MWDWSVDFRPHLMLTYYHFPFHLKRCFAYCAIFRRSYVFEVNELVFLWMAEGLMQQPEGNSQMEDLGVRYFHELFSWSLFKRSNYNEFVMDNLNVNLDCHIGGDMYCILEEGESYLEVISERTCNIMCLCCVRLYM